MSNNIIPTQNPLHSGHECNAKISLLFRSRILLHHTKKVFAVSRRSASFAPESTTTAHLPTYHSPPQLTFLLAVRRLSLYPSIPSTTSYSLHPHHHLLLLLQPITTTIFFCFYSSHHLFCSYSPSTLLSLAPTHNFRSSARHLVVTAPYLRRLANHPDHS